MRVVLILQKRHCFKSHAYFRLFSKKEKICTRLILNLVAILKYFNCQKIRKRLYSKISIIFFKQPNSWTSQLINFLVVIHVYHTNITLWFHSNIHSQSLLRWQYYKSAILAHLQLKLKASTFIHPRINGVSWESVLVNLVIFPR